MLTACALALPAATRAASLTIDDFESGGVDKWWVSGSGDYYKGGDGRKGLSVLRDAERGSMVMRAHIRFGRAEESDKCFISRNFATPNPIMAYERVSFWYKLSTASLDPKNAFVCRLRVSSNSFLDLHAATPETIRPGQWVHADMPIVPSRIRNIYGVIFLPVKQVTFRLDDEDTTNVEFDLCIDDFRLHPKRQVAADYEPRLSPLAKRATPRVLVVRQSAAGYYNIEEALESMPEQPETRLSLFRGLHLPLSRFPATRDELFTYDAVVMIDVDPYVVTGPQLQWLVDLVASGGGLFFVAGPNTMGKAIDFKPGLADMLPVTVPKDRGPDPTDCRVRVAADHPAVRGVPRTLGLVRSTYPLEVKPGAQTLLKIEGEALSHWGMYSGGGRDTGAVVIGPGHESARCAGLVTKGFYVDPKTGKPKFISLALIVGDSDGYSGPRAYPCRANTTYRLSFWLKGDLPHVTPEGLAWKADEAKRTDRQHLGTTIGRIRPTPDWRRYEGTFTTRPDSKRLVVGFRFSHGAGGFELGKRIFVDDVKVVNAKTGAPLPIENGDAEDAFSPPILVAGQFHRGRVLVLNAFPTASDRGGQASLFRGPFFDELIRDGVRWLSQREAVVAFEQVSLAGAELHRGDVASLTAAVRSSAGKPITVALKVDGRAQSKTELVRAGSEKLTLRFAPNATVSAGEHRLSIEAIAADGKPLARRDATVTLHEPVQAAVRFLRWNTVEAGQPLRCEVNGTFRHTAKDYTGDVAISGRLIDPDGQAVAALGPVQAQVEKGPMAPVDMALPLPDLTSGTYTLEVELACNDASFKSIVREEIFIVDPLERENFFPIMGVSGISGGDQQLDLRGQRARIDELWAHGFNTVTADSSVVVAHAARKGMALFKDYTRLTLCGRHGHSTPCVYAPEHEQVLSKRLKGYVAMGNAIPRGTSLKILDEPYCRPGDLAACEHCRREFERRFGYPMPKKAELAELPLAKRTDFARFMADYVVRSYSEVKRLCQSMGARFDLIATYNSPGFGGAALRAMQDIYTWSRHADRIDYDQYVYFYPRSQRVRYVMAHYAYAMIRDVADHLGKKWGHYTEIDDRNYPYQVNPVEASSEHTYTAIAHDADYINTFITRVFATGCGARDARWADFGREACKIRSVGPLLNRLDRPRSELAIYFPYACYCTRVKNRHAPHYAHQLLTRAFGEADVTHELTVLDEGLKDRKAIVLCDTDVLPDRAAGLLNEFVKAGGLLICDHVPSTNERGEPCKLAPALFAGGEVSKLGELTTVRTCRVGRGRCLLIGGALDRLYEDAIETPNPADEKALRDFVWVELSQAGLKPFARAVDPEFEIGVLAGEGTWLLVVINHAEESRTTRVALSKLPFAPSYTADLPSYAPFKLAADQRSFDITLPSRHSKMIALYEHKPSRVELTAADTTRGGALRYAVELRTDGGDLCRGHHLVDVSVRDPHGKPCTRFGGRWVTSGGKIERSVRVPVNTRRGTWTVECSFPGTQCTSCVKISISDRSG